MSKELLVVAAKKRAGGPGWYAAFLANLRNTANVRASCNAAGVSRKVAWAAQKRDPDFAAAWSSLKHRERKTRMMAAPPPS